MESGGSFQVNHLFLALGLEWPFPIPMWNSYWKVNGTQGWTSEQVIQFKRNKSSIVLCDIELGFQTWQPRFWRITHKLELIEEDNMCGEVAETPLWKDWWSDYVGKEKRLEWATEERQINTMLYYTYHSVELVF